MGDAAKRVTHVHDGFFRTVMSNLRVARELMLAHLPKNLLQVIDLNSLVLQPRSHISAIRKETIVDVLYRATMRHYGSSKEPLVIQDQVYLYILIEHQSSPDPAMAFRLLKYTINILESHMKITKSNRLPLVYPLVIYHGRQPFSYSTSIKDYVNAPQHLVEQYFLQPFHLVDLQLTRDSELKKHSWAGVMECALKYIFSQDGFLHLKDMVSFMKKTVEAGGEEYVLTVLEYFFECSRIETREAFFDFIYAEVFMELGEKLMNLRERIKEKGRLEGRQEGLNQGLQEAKMEIAKQLLLEGVSLDFIVKVTGLLHKEIRALHGTVV